MGVVDDTDLPNAFSNFFAGGVSTLGESFTPQEDIVISRAWLSSVFKRVNIGKAADRDAICGRALHNCADQPSVVFSTLFQMCAVSVSYLLYGKHPR